MVDYNKLRLGIDMVEKYKVAHKRHNEITKQANIDTFENAKAVAELLMPNSPAAPLQATKKPKSKNPEN